MTQIERCLIFKSSPHDVFAGLIDIERIPEWISNIKKAYLTSPLPMEVGTTFVQHTVFMGQSFQIAGKVAKYAPPAAFGYIYAEGILASVWNYQITPINSGSQLLITIEFIEAGGLIGVFKRLLRPVLRRIIDRNIDNFNAWVESKHARKPGMKRPLSC